LYRHHTGYPGGLKEYTFKHILERNPKRILIDAVKGMLPRNKLRDVVIEKKLKIYEGSYHSYNNIGLPQFTEKLPVDLNKEIGFESFDKENFVIQYTSNEDPNNVPKELEGVPEDIDHSIGTPIGLMTKTHKEHRYNYKLGRAMIRSHKFMRRYKKYKP